MRARIVVLLLGVCLLMGAQPPIMKFWALNKSMRPSAAYSVRKLYSTYTGPAFRVRRASNGQHAEGDVYFDASGQISSSSNVIITKKGNDYNKDEDIGKSVSFFTFYNGLSVYVTTWYDQSGNGKNLTQTTKDANQPQIVNDGQINLENEKPTIRFMDTSDKMVAPAMNIQTFSAVRRVNDGGAQSKMQYLVSVPIDQDFAIRSSSRSTYPFYYGDDNVNDFSDGGAFYVNNILTKIYPQNRLHCLCVIVVQ